MENLVPLGTGNSRLMKSNIPASTTLAQLIQMWNNGTFPYDIGPLNSAGISQQGTPLNKDTLLKDTTASAFGLTDTALPDDVLQILKKAVLYKSISTPLYIPVTVNFSTVKEDDIVRLPEGDTIENFRVLKLNYEPSLNGSGRILLMRENSLGSYQWNDSRNTDTYIQSSVDSTLSQYVNQFPSEIRAAIATTSFTTALSNSSTTTMTASRKAFLLSVTETGLSTTYANVEGSAISTVQNNVAVRMGGCWTRTHSRRSNSEAFYIDNYGSVYESEVTTPNGIKPCFTVPNTFQYTYYVGSPSGISSSQNNHYEYMATSVTGNELGRIVRLTFGGYVGTGTSGSAHPNTLTLPFDPLMLFFSWYTKADSEYRTVFPWTNTITFDHGSSSSSADDCILERSNNGKTFTWYNDQGNSTEAISAQGNEVGVVYHYIAIG